MDSQQFEEISDMLDTIKSEIGVLNPWELSFIEDQIKRVEKYGADVYFSAKQLIMLRKIYKSIAGDESKPAPVGHNGGPDF